MADHLTLTSPSFHHNIAFTELVSPSTAHLTSPSHLTSQTSESTHASAREPSDAGLRQRQVQPGSVAVDVAASGYAGRGSVDEEKGADINPKVARAYQQKSQELSLRINSLTARRELQEGKTAPVSDPDALSADLGTLDVDELGTDVHLVPVELLAQRVHSDFKAGLTAAQVEINRTEYGSNAVSSAGEVSYIVLFAQQLMSGFNILLWIATIVIFLSWQPLGSLNQLTASPVNLAVSALLLVVIFVQAGFNLYMVVGAINIVRSFSEIKLGAVHVMRAGKDEHIAAEELVVGDLVYIELGQRIPADIRLIHAQDLHVDNSALTGESELISCTTRCTNASFLESRNLCFMGTACPQGSGFGIVVATGDQAVIGQINKLTQSGNDNFNTSLHHEINRFVTIIACAALFTGVCLCIVWGSWLYHQHYTFLLPAAFILQLISIIVAFVPEGLPVTVTLTLVIIAKRMYAQNVLVRNLAIVETFNSLSLIATDKTGTLTLNKMTITEMVWGQQERLVIPHTVDPTTKAGQLNSAMLKDEAVKALALGGALCNSSTVQEGLDGSAMVLGDAADTALHHLLDDKLGLPPENIRSQYPRLCALPFNSKNKFMIVCSQAPTAAPGSSTLPALMEPAAEPQVVCFLKGAPEVVLQCCSSAFIDGTRVEPLTEALKQSILSRQNSMGRSGLRVIAMCRIVMPLTAFSKQFNQSGSESELERVPSSNYAFVGMYGLLDPPREQVAESILKAHSAGVRVAMLTGDHATTAVSIARQVHIIPKSAVAEEDIHTLRLAQDSLGRAVMEIVQNEKVVSSHVLGRALEVKKEEATAPEPRTWVGKVGAWVKTSLVGKPIEPRIVATPTAAVITGNDLRVFDDWMWDWALRHRYLVFARTSPEQKLKIVGEAQKRHEVVAVTGDGVNDAPALKQADLGMAMQAGTDVAREAGDIVLLDNNFASVMAAMETGRVVSDNLKKVCLYLMVGGTWSEMWTVVANVFFAVPTPLGSFEEIGVSIGTDILDALALVQEKPEAAIMTRPPIDRRTAHLVDWKVALQAYGFLGFICTFGAFLCQFWYYQSEGLYANCVFFAFTWENGDPYSCSHDSQMVTLSEEQQVSINLTAQAVYYVALVTINWFQMMATRTRYASIFQHNPIYGRGQNLWLFVSMGVGVGLTVFVLNVGWFNATFGTSSAPVKYVLPAIGFGALLLTFDELRKWWIRHHPNGFWARIAW
jgi:sodium/potassium-transporting ATPase subunit alpha